MDLRPLLSAALVGTMVGLSWPVAARAEEAQDSAAIETTDSASVDLSTDPDTASDAVAAPGEDSSAHEVEALELLSLRPAGRPEVADTAAQIALATPAVAPELPGEVDYLADPPGGYSSYEDRMLDDSDMVHGRSVYEQILYENFGIDYSNPNHWDYACEPEEMACPCWRVFGEIGAASGSSTFSDNDSSDVELNEEYTSPRGNKYLFYQRYDIEHTYINSGELTLGAKQDLQQVLWHGDLKLTEEFRNYDDRDFDTNDRQEGLFDLRFNPQSADGRWRADLSYRYNIKERYTFSPLSYKMHRGRMRVQRQVGCDLTGAVSAEINDYNYSLGSDRDNRRNVFGTDWEWRPSDDVTVTAAVERDEKQYEVRRDRDYEQDRYDAALRWRVDERTQANLRARVTSYDRPFDPDGSYDETLLDARVARQLSDEWGAELHASTREKQFGDPSDDLSQRSADGGLTYAPSQQWSFYARGGRDDYNYTDPNHAFAADRFALGAQYYDEGWSVGLDAQRQRNLYDVDPDRNFTRDTLGANVGYRHGRHDLSLYAQLGSLNQRDPASVNDYEETQLSARWTYKIDPCTDFILSYESSLRDYAVQDSIRDQTVEARLRFEL